MRRAFSLSLLLFTVAVLGCGDGYQPAPPPPAPPQPTAQAPAAANPQQTGPTQSGMTVSMEATGSAVGLAPMDAVSGPSGVAPVQSRQPQPTVTTQKAEVGVGAKGHDYGTGPVATPAATYWRAEERIKFASLKHEQDIYEQINGPIKSNEEYMKFVADHNMRLPMLKPNQHYQYDPQQKELLVVTQGQ